MTIDDSTATAARRNLTTTSFGFIIFFAGHGRMVDSTLRLPMLNVTFDRTEVIIVAAWVLLLWFAFRWHQFSRGRLFESMRAELESASPSRLMRAYARRKLKASNPHAEPISDSPVRITNSAGWPMVLTAPIRVGQEQTKGQRLQIEGSSGRILIAYSLLKNAFSKESAGTYLLPWLLFFIAISGPLWSK